MKAKSLWTGTVSLLTAGAVLVGYTTPARAQFGLNVDWVQAGHAITQISQFGQVISQGAQQVTAAYNTLRYFPQNVKATWITPMVQLAQPFRNGNPGQWGYGLGNLASATNTYEGAIINLGQASGRWARPGQTPDVLPGRILVLNNPDVVPQMQMAQIGVSDGYMVSALQTGSNGNQTLLDSQTGLRNLSSRLSSSDANSNSPTQAAQMGAAAGVINGQINQAVLANGNAQLGLLIANEVRESNKERLNVATWDGARTYIATEPTAVVMTSAAIKSYRMP
ncbi:MAG: hypothetical protein ACJ74Z_03515 [Bryobacteraceae bacterium]|jgi:hypothetical protein